ncbi:multicopper oxidase domain-containing protein [Aestuariirhabdus sp. LZHN29]|uniref:multicopper oxidase domain-containing protein n=1 Tax=Aestuariirhabdus sp. LZHN29 TaxID=3417462 RepID=UPI003CE9FB7E
MKALLAGCLAAVLLSVSLFANAADYITNASEIVSNTDWDKMETVRVIMGEKGEKLFYKPQKLTFKAGQPYKLELVNKGKKKHYFTAAGFFRNIATRKVQSDKDGEIKAPYFLALEMMPKGGKLDLYFVPVTPGEYDVICTIDDHADRGMHGSITIEP